MYENATNSYQQASCLTATPMKLILMCYDGAISNLKLARDSYAAKEYEAKGRALRRALDIIHELNASLDMQKGGEIALNLRALYTYMIQALIKADLKRDLTIFGNVIHMLEELEGQWKEISSGRCASVAPRPVELSKAATPSVMAGRTWSA